MNGRVSYDIVRATTEVKNVFVSDNVIEIEGLLFPGFGETQVLN